MSNRQKYKEKDTDIEAHLPANEHELPKMSPCKKRNNYKLKLEVGYVVNI